MNHRSNNQSFNRILLIVAVTLCFNYVSSQTANSQTRYGNFYEREFLNKKSFGINVGYWSPSSWATFYPYSDAWKHSSPWTGKIDSMGNPLPAMGEVSSSTALGSIYPKGIYTLTYQGETQIEIQPAYCVIKKEDGKIEINNSYADNITVKVQNINSANPPREFHLWMPCMSDTSFPFHPDFLEMLKPYSFIRAHQWLPCWTELAKDMETWEQRPKIEDNTYVNRGLPYELFVELCNFLKSDPWISLPVRANDDFIRNFARLIKEKVDNERKIYIEYTNEPKNGGNVAKAKEYLQEKASIMGFGSDNTGVLKYYAYRSRQIFNIINEEFGKDSTRIIKVLQTDDPNILAFQDTYKHIDAIAINTYFGYPIDKLIREKKGKEYQEATKEEVFEVLRLHLQNEITERIKSASDLTKKYGLDLLAYEANHHLHHYGTGVKDEKFIAEMKTWAFSEQMATMITDMFDIWFENNGGRLCYFNLTGNFGLTPSMGYAPNESPNNVSVIDYIEKKNSITISDFNDDNKVIFVYPNPFTNNIRLEIPEHKSDVKLFDVSGKLILETIENDKYIDLNLPELDYGLYLLKITVQDNIYVAKIIKN